jgi:hypothetical protein
MEDQDLSLEQLVRKQATLIDRLQEQLGQKDPEPSDKAATIDINDVRVPYKHKKFPMLVYRRDEKRDAAHDHPGQKHKTVASEKELEAAKKEGWTERPLDIELTEDGKVAVKSAGSRKAPAA